MLPLFLAVIAPNAVSAAPEPAPRSAPTPTNGPWPPQEVLAADPAGVAQPLAAESATTCPAAPYGVRTSAPGTGKTVALTFDDGPGRGTLQILSILQQHGIAATFFNLGVNSTARPQDVRSEAALGLTLGNHTWNHPQMPTLSSAGQAKQMDDASNQQVALVGTAPCLFRPPYGEYNATTLTLAQQRRMSVWNWSVDTEDWRAGTSTSQEWVDRIVSRAIAGGSQQHPVVLLHNPPAGIPATVAALPRIISYYRSNGYRFVDLFGRTGYGRPAPAATVTGGGLHLLVRATNGALNERTRRGAAWTGWRSLGGAMINGAAAAPVTAAATGAFVTGTDSQVWHRTLADGGGVSGWVSLGGRSTSKPSAARSPNGVLTVVVRGPDTAAWMRQKTGAGWTSWQSLGGVLATAPAVAVSASGGITVAAVGTDNGIWIRHRATTGWTSWTRLGGAVTADPALTTTADGSRLALVVRGSDGAGWVKVGNANGTGWSGWRSIGGQLASGAAATGNGPALHVFGYGTDGRIHERVAANGAAGTGWSSWRAVPN